ncbi:S1C family serine protease [Deinococcus sp. YIM 77859]|uniref:S1C family serine protease n=1 Tax=Deinococcus sp. YIM 77859 TaxID=1540221 RepID=UPI0005573412|nr:S1C family serine protease [Deinococcus sp. YIM 77859]
MNAIRKAALRGLTLLLLLGSGAAQMPSASAPAPLPTRSAAPQTAPQPLSVTETATLRALFQKLRPAALRIEACPPNDCRNPDGVGSAFLIGDGYALTAYHVVFAAKSLSAVTLDRKRYAVEVVGYDDQSDLALIRVNVPSGTPFLPLASGRPQVGEPALAIGNGGGAFLTLKTGRLTGLNADAGRADFPPGTLEMNVQLVPGDSGGPVLNARGEVIGVVSYISVTRGNSITSYAVPVTQDDATLAQLRQGVKREAPVIGIGLDPRLNFVFALTAEEFLTLNRASNLGLGDTPGAFFTSVEPGSPAERAGLQPLNYDASGKKISGDIVTAVNGQRVLNFSDFQYAVRRYQPGETITLTVLRGGQQLQVQLTLAPRSRLRS